jgi:hypothetical protein
VPRTGTIYHFPARRGVSFSTDSLLDPESPNNRTTKNLHRERTPRAHSIVRFQAPGVVVMSGIIFHQPKQPLMSGHKSFTAEFVGKLFSRCKGGAFSRCLDVFSRCKGGFPVEELFPDALMQARLQNTRRCYGFPIIKTQQRVKKSTSTFAGRLQAFDRGGVCSRVYWSFGGFIRAWGFIRV